MTRTISTITAAALVLANLAHADDGAGRPDHALEPARLLTRPGPEYGSAARLYQGVPTIARHDASGRLWAAWYTGGRGECQENHVVVVTSGDDGLTWTQPVLAIAPTPPIRTFDPCLWTAPDGRLLLFYAQNDATEKLHDGRWGVWLTICADPARADAAWSAPVRIADGIMTSKPTVLRDGSWMLPVARWEDPVQGAGVLRSRDGGKTFAWIGGVPGRCVKWGDSGTGGGMEHMIVERDDGTLWMPMRIDDGLAEATSADGGKTWTAPVRSAIDGPGSRFHVRRLRSGRLLLLNHVGFPKEAPALARRTNVTALLSDDEGRTWPHQLLLDDREQVSYPDAVETPDGKLYIIYDRGRLSDREILLAIITESDIRAGKPGPSARLRVLVDKATGPR